jgi:hypothetical protein
MNGLAVYMTREKCRCFHLNTDFGLTDAEALWPAISAWVMPRQDPGYLYYQNEFCHVFEKYWDFLPCLNQYPDFAAESEYTRRSMMLFSRGMSWMAHGTFELRPSAEAPDKAVLVAEHAAVSRLRPIQDGPDCWEEHWRCAATGLGGQALG